MTTSTSVPEPGSASANTEPLRPSAPPWAAPVVPAPISATVTVPGSKSETNRALVLAALADRSSVIRNGLDARDTQLMREALRTLGVVIAEAGDQWRVTPPGAFRADGTVDCGLAGTVMRFVPALAALADGPIRFVGDPQAAARPMAPLLDALRNLGAEVSGEHGAGTAAASGLPFTVTGRQALPGGRVVLDASTSSQYVSALLLVGPRLVEGIDIRHVGPPVPSLPHIEMTVAMLRERGVVVDDSEPDRWRVEPGVIRARDVTVEPDLSGAAPFLAAAAITGGSVTVPHWPTATTQGGDLIREILQAFGAEVTRVDGSVTVRGTGHLSGIDLDLRAASELTPVVAAVAALAEGTTRIRGVGHIRGHETDRLAALDAELSAMGGGVAQTEDGLTVHPMQLSGTQWHTYADHRLAQAGALLGLVVPGVELDDVACTTKTMPGFVDLWHQMIADSAAR